MSAQDHYTDGWNDAEQKWAEVVLNLLKHFDDNEGTTYLYNRDAREQFVRECPFAIQRELRRMLDLYHDKGRG